MRSSRTGIAMICALLLPAALAQGTPDISVQYVGTVSLSRLSAGGIGRGALLYFPKGGDPDRPKLVVVLSRGATASYALAQIYEVPPDANHVPVVREGSLLRVDKGLQAAIAIKALGGWWRHGKTVNYNLDIQVSTPSYSIWGASYSPAKGFGGPAEDVKPGEPFVAIRVRDPTQSGIPQWALRTLLPSFKGRQYLRSNYVERMCGSPATHEYGVSPLWPYVAASGGFEQPVGVLRPPIVVNWDKGKILYVSEFVTARNQNCSYTIYSVSRLDSGRINVADFEAPFAFYDLSGHGRGFPNLIIRGEHYPAGDPWSKGLAPGVLHGAPVRSTFETVRYSWSDQVGDGTFDYKIGVLGTSDYTSQTSIAGGDASVTAPSYGAFPNWVVERPWPVVTFVSTEGHAYRSSEGIYEWSPRAVGAPYFLGRDAHPSADAFKTIRKGLRGEYRVGEATRPQLYFSPVDERLHLMGADAGLMNLGNGWILRLKNLTGGPYIDSWQLTQSTINMKANPGPHGAMHLQQLAAPGAARPARLVQAGNLLILAENGALVVKEAHAHSAAFVVQPPTDSESWKGLRGALNAHEGAGRSPFDMQAWLEAFAGPSLELYGVSLSGVYGGIEAGDIELVLRVGKTLRYSGKLYVPVLSNLGPGTYVFSYSPSQDRWQRRIATAPRISATLSSGNPVAFHPSRLVLTLANAGSLDYRGPLTLAIGNTKVRRWNEVTVPGSGSVELAASWAPNRAGTFVADLQLRSSHLKLEPLQAVTGSSAGPSEMLGLSRGTALALTVLLLLASASILAFWWNTRPRE